MIHFKQVPIHTAIDYIFVGARPGDGISNLQWEKDEVTPNSTFTVTILDDDVPEPVEVIEVQVVCENNENCYSPISVYTITIFDDQGD